MTDAPSPKLTEEQTERLVLSIVRRQPDGLHEDEIVRRINRIQEEWRKHKTMIALYELVFEGKVDIDASAEDAADWKFFDAKKANDS